MLIGEVANKFRISVDTLRYYEKIGLLTPKRERGLRIYSEKELLKLQQILLMKELLFSLEEIKRVLEIDEIIDQGIEKGKILLSDVEKIQQEIQRKYEEVLQKERHLGIVKSHLEELLEKIREFKKDGERL